MELTQAQFERIAPHLPVQRGNITQLHHLTPFSELEEGETREVRSEDFAVLCASCHRAIHRTDYVNDVQRCAKEYCPSE